MDPAFLLGMTMAKAVNPVIGIGGFLLGFVTPRWWIALPVAIVAGTLLAIMGTGPSSSVVPDVASCVVAVLVWTLIGIGARTLTRRRAKA